MSVVVVHATTVVIQQCEHSASIPEWLTALAQLLLAVTPLWLAMTAAHKKPRVKKKTKKKSR